MRLADCLQAQTWRHLQAICRCRRLPFDAHKPKTDLICALAERLKDIQTALDGLDNESRSVLTALLEGGGSLRRDEVVRRFGHIRAYRPWRADADRAPWRNPQTPAEEILFRGLAFAVTMGTVDHPVPVIVLPDEFHESVRRLVLPPAAPACAFPATLASPLCFDMSALLSLLNRQDVRPLGRRWLPPGALRELGARLSQPLRLAGVRSERHVPYVAFLHYLGERADLVHGVDGLLKPSLLAREWLSWTLTERLRLLWRASMGSETSPRTSPDPLWSACRLPGWQVEGMGRRIQRLLHHLARRAPGGAQPTDAFLDALADVDPSLFRIEDHAHWASLTAETQAGFQAQVHTALAALLDGPLTWFGLLSGAPPALTGLGAALLGRTDGTWPHDPGPSPLRIASELTETGQGPAIALTVPPGLPLAQRFALEGLLPPSNGETWVLTQAKLLQALQRGYTVEGILAVLENAAMEPLPSTAVAALHDWAADWGQLAIRQVVLMEAREPAALQAVTRSRRVRELLGETLSARVVHVHSDRVSALLRRLAAHGVYPRLELAGLQASASDRGLAKRQAPTDKETLALALSVYAVLAEELGLPAYPAQAQARALVDSLSLPQRDAVERAVEQALRRLRRARVPEGDYRLPVPTGPLLARLEQAIAEETTIEIDYYTAGRDHEMTRQVDPLRIEWRGPVAYLVAFCHLRGEQRVFRIDRIASIRAPELPM